MHGRPFLHSVVVGGPVGPQVGPTVLKLSVGCGDEAQSTTTAQMGNKECGVRGGEGGGRGERREGGRRQAEHQKL